ncbi:tudor domain-containing protein 5 [Bactrocera dorsalis]|uniref:Tudor domain-containing protein 5 n=1 Tax=Bactrocera dorsalis TaxID=27457 RepID=A0A6I9VFJ8_BACDO|nr:tudor domain-containing protein 5 [Bactrocera dorsalis]
MEIGYLQEVKAIIKSLVISCPKAITIDELNRDYRNIEGQRIPYHKLGFQTLESFLRSIPDTVNVYGSGPSASVGIVLNEKSAHIHKMVNEQKKTRNKPKSSKEKIMPVNASYFDKPHSAGQKVQISSKKISNNTLPSSNIRLSHFISRSGPRNTIIKCQALDTSKFMVKRVEQKPIQFSGQSFPDDVKEINKPLHLMPGNNLQSNKSIHKISETIPQVKHETISHSEVEQNIILGRSPLTQLKQDEYLWKIFGMCEIRDEVDVDSSRNRTVENGKQNFTTEISNNNENRDELSVRNVFKPLSLKNSLEKSHIDDIEEAVPAFAANSLVFRMDFPENTMTFGKKIPPYKISDQIIRGSIIGIFISEIHSPYKFWFHIYKKHHELDELMLQIERFYTSLEPEIFCIPSVCVCPGQVCAALYKGLWHRAEILTSVIGNKAKVFFVDYGTVSNVPVSNIKFLLTSFARLPKQAIRGSLSHICPNNYHWSPESIQYFLSLSSELMLYGQVSEINEKKRIIHMVLCDSNRNEVLQINRELVEKGFAFYDEQWLKSDKDELRTHHLREDFPTFSMLEMGEYPSLAELVDLKNKGIDYERITDHHVFHPGRLDLQENVPDEIRRLPFQLLTTNPFRQDIYLQLKHLL